MSTANEYIHEILKVDIQQKPDFVNQKVALLRIFNASNINKIYLKIF